MRTYLRFAVLLSFSLLFFGAISSTAQITIRVPADQPTIQAGINAANNGDTVLVSPNTYNENLDFKGKAITVTSGAANSAGAAGTLIQGVGTAPVVTFQSNEPRAATLNGFAFQNGNGLAILLKSASATISNNAFLNNAGCAIVGYGSTTSPRITGNEIAQMRQQTTGIQPGVICDVPANVQAVENGSGITFAGAGDIEVMGNTFKDGNSTIGGELVSECPSPINVRQSSSLLLENNVIRNNAGICESAFSIENTTSISILQNLIYGNITMSKGSSTTGSAGPAVSLVNDPLYPGITTQQITFSNNTLAGNITPQAPDYAGSQFAASNSYTNPAMYGSFENNLFISSGETGVVAGCDFSPSDKVVFSHNDFLNQGTQITPAKCLANGPAVANLTADPQFLNPVNGDVHTQPTSPVVAAGDINAPLIPATDLDGKNRTVCGSIDMGVYEVHPQPATVVTSSNNPSVGGTPVTFTATVPGNCNVPTGTVTFLDNGAALSSPVALSAGATATYTTSALTVGSHNITATYPGDFNFDASTSAALVQIVTGYPTTTSLLQVSPNPAIAFQTILFSAFVASGVGTPGGTVTFYAGTPTGTTALGTAVLNASGVASISNATLGAGTYIVTAVYNASTSYASSTSASATLVVNGAVTSIALTSAPNPSSPGIPISFTATVTAPQSTATPTGTVALMDGAVKLAGAALSSTGVAQFSISTLAVGTHNMTAVYSGSTNDNAGTSNIDAQVVTVDTTTLKLTASPNPANAGQTVALTATVSTLLAGLPPPAGTVTFSDQNGPLGTVTVSAGIASLSIATLTIGTHNITATFTGAGAASSSATVAEVILAYDFTMTISPASLAIPSGDYQNLQVTLTPIGGFNGGVTLNCTSVPINAECVFQPSGTAFLAGGPHTVTLVLNTSQIFKFGQRAGSLDNPPAPGRRNTGFPLNAFLVPVLALGAAYRRRSKRLILNPAVEERKNRQKVDCERV